MERGPAHGREVRGGGWLRLLWAVWLALGTSAFAATLTIDTADDPEARLELRTYALPDGSSADLLVLTGRSVTVTVDDLTITGTRLEIDLTARVVRVVGTGTFARGSERVEGRDLEIALADERVRALDAIVITDEVDVRGVLAERLPGQIAFADAFFSPCTRCAQATPDYGFRADRLVLFPGDRLVGWDATVLVRGVETLRVPVLVIPLAGGDRQPQLLVTSGTGATRAQVQVRWPYVAGATALGTFTVRYLAEVDPSRPGGPVGQLLGGAVEGSAVAFELDHRAYDALGTATLQVAHDPGRVPDPTDPNRAPEPATWRLRVAYRTEPDGPSPSVDAELLRDDARTRGRWTYRLALAGEDALLRGTVSSQGYVDTDPAVPTSTPPAYATISVPRRTAWRLEVAPVDPTAWDLGRLRLTTAHLDLGLFEDTANPANRRAAVPGIVDGGRARLAHTLRVETVDLWPGASLEADNAFEGRYYDTQERAVTWRSRVGVTQRFGDAGQLVVSFLRDVEEGITPFRFDAAPPRARTEATARFSVRLAPWVTLASDGGYVFVEARRPETVGWAPLQSRLTLFQDQTWIDASLEHTWPLRDDDLGTVTASVSLQGRAAGAEVRTTLTRVTDLQPSPGPPVDDDGRTTVAWRVALDRVMGLDLDATHADVGDAGDPTWTDATVGATLGSLRSGDARPGLRVDARFDLDVLTVRELTVRARADVGPVALDLTERVSLADGTLEDARVQARWTGVAVLDARGVAWLPVAWLVDAPASERRELSVRLADAPDRREPRWEASWRATRDPALADAGGLRDSRFEVRLALVQERWGPVNLSVDALLEWALADAMQPSTFLRRGALTVGADAFERVGLQGRFGYAAAYDAVSDDLARSTLTIDDLTLALRPTEELLVGARLDDVWELTGGDPARSPWTIRPEVFFVWDRCCWALIGAWDTATGEVRVALTGPGGGPGLSEIFDTGLALPRTPLREDAP